MEVTLVETPRDAFQGLPLIVPTAEKILYIGKLLDAGFKHVDLGSFVSPRAVPQMADSPLVFEAFKDRPNLERIGIVANLEGARRACLTEGVDTLGFPFSLSETFQVANTRIGRAQTGPVLRDILDAAQSAGKGFILYLSMAFGNLDGEAWSEAALSGFVCELAGYGVKHVSLADTVAVAQPDQVKETYRHMGAQFPEVTFSGHFHGVEQNWFDCISAALDGGCRRFDCAVGGLGGCPFANDALIGNTPTEELVQRLNEMGIRTGVSLSQLRACAALAAKIKTPYAP